LRNGRKNDSAFSHTFPLLVPSLSWQNGHHLCLYSSNGSKKTADFFHFAPNCPLRPQVKTLHEDERLERHEGRARVIHRPLSENASLFLSAFPMFVPNLSW
jgi:hypothetical protein